MGISQIVSSPQGPVGYDEYGYGIADKNGARIHCGVLQSYGGRAFGAGDVVGVLLTIHSQASIPDEEGALLAHSITTTFPPPKYCQYRVRQDLMRASLRFFVNGSDCGVAFEPLYRAKYYPTVSLYNDAAARLHTSPQSFRYAPHHLGILRPVASLFQEEEEEGGVAASRRQQD